MLSTLLRRVAPLALLAVLASAVPGLAQTEAGRIEGIVTDTTGAAIPGATVEVTNLATNVATVVVTNEAGR